jgi:hypothetical protein
VLVAGCFSRRAEGAGVALGGVFSMEGVVDTAFDQTMSTLALLQ